jgi:hypothetical protein
MIRSVHWTQLIWSVWAFLLCANPVFAADAEKEETAQIHIRVIYAVKDATHSVDPSLEDIRTELEELPFTKFRLMDKLETDVGINSAVELQFSGKQSISVRFRGIDTSKGKKMLALELSVKPALKIEMRVAENGRTLLLGPVHLDGNLILDVSVKLKEKKS